MLFYMYDNMQLWELVDPISHFISLSSFKNYCISMQIRGSEYRYYVYEVFGNQAMRGSIILPIRSFCV